MKANNLRSKPASIAKTRWAAYASAAAATALVGSQSAEAAIHYSGRLNVLFNGCCFTFHTFPLDQPGDNFALKRYVTDYGVHNTFFINGIASAAFRGYTVGNYNTHYVSKLRLGQRISAGAFVEGTGHLVGSPGFYVPGAWKSPGAGCIGFRFNKGAGVQYGWARIRTAGHGQRVGSDPNFPVSPLKFALFDYAYADPGESITAGQMSSDEQAPVEQSPNQGSLGWLALGAMGLLAWRKSRSRSARLEEA
jgi:hypothetical protein